MPSEITLDKNVLISMRDGVRLAADCYRPAGDGPWPAIVSAYPYHKDGMIGVSFTAALKRFAGRGYAAFLVDCRGTGGSDGASTDALESASNHDLFDLVEWIGTRSWCTGKVGMWGISYGGVTALKTASLHPPHLAAIAPIYGVADFQRTWLMPGGRPNLLGSMGAWMSFMQAMNVAPPLFRDEGGRWRALWEERLRTHEPYLLDVTPTGAFLDSHQEFVARIGTGEHANPQLEAEYALDVLQDGDTVRVRTSERVTRHEVELRSSITVNDEERYRREWRRTWRAP